MLYLFEYAKETIHILSSQSVKGEQQNLFITYRRGRKCFQKRQSVILSNGGGDLIPEGSAYRGVCIQDGLHPKGWKDPPHICLGGGVLGRPLCVCVQGSAQPSW